MTNSSVEINFNVTPAVHNAFNTTAMGSTIIPLMCETLHYIVTCECCYISTMNYIAEYGQPIMYVDFFQTQSCDILHLIVATNHICCKWKGNKNSSLRYFGIRSLRIRLGAYGLLYVQALMILILLQKILLRYE